jgi:hypothetical protein
VLGTDDTQANRHDAPSGNSATPDPNARALVREGTDQPLVVMAPEGVAELKQRVGEPMVTSLRSFIAPHSHRVPGVPPRAGMHEPGT